MVLQRMPKKQVLLNLVYINQVEKSKLNSPKYSLIISFDNIVSTNCFQNPSIGYIYLMYAVALIIVKLA